MEANLRLKLEGDETTGEEGVYAVAALLQLTYVHLPEAYNEAVSAKQAAEEDIALAVAERKLETTKATTNLLIAEQLAVKTKDTANNEAEVLLIEAKLKAQETMYSIREKIKLSSVWCLSGVCLVSVCLSVRSSSIRLFVEGVSVVYNNCSVNTVV